MITDFRLYEYHSQMTNWFSDSKATDEQGNPLILYHGTMDKIVEFDERYCGDNTCNNEHGVFYFTDNEEIAEDYSRQAFIRRYDGRDVEELMDDDFDEYDAQEIVDDINDYAEEQIKTIPVYLKIMKPYIMDAKGGPADIGKTQKIINLLKNHEYSDDIEEIYYELIENSYDKEEIEENREEIEELARSNNGLDEDDEIEEYMFDDASRELLTTEDFDYDGIIYKNCIDDISEQSAFPSDVYIVFYSNQIKHIESENFSISKNIYESKKLFDSRFYEPTYSVVAHNAEEFDVIIHDSKQKMSDRIRYFNYHNYYKNPEDTIYFTLYADDLIIGINKIVKVQSESQKERYKNADYVVAYFSIDRDFRNKKLSELLYDTMFSWMKENGYSKIASTEMSVPGKIKLKDLKIRLGEKYGIEVITQERSHDSVNMYNDDLIHYDEMTDDEKKKFDKQRPKSKWSGGILGKLTNESAEDDLKKLQIVEDIVSKLKDKVNNGEIDFVDTFKIELGLEKRYKQDFNNVATVKVENIMFLYLDIKDDTGEHILPILGYLQTSKPITILIRLDNIETYNKNEIINKIKTLTNEYSDDGALVHEITHKIDNENYDFNNNVETLSKYYNSSYEYNAYYTQLTKYLKKKYIKGGTYHYFLSLVTDFKHSEYGSFIEYLNNKMKKHLNKRLYKLFIELNN